MRSKIKEWLVYGLIIVLLLGSSSIYLNAMEGEADAEHASRAADAAAEASAEIEQPAASEPAEAAADEASMQSEDAAKSEASEESSGADSDAGAETSPAAATSAAHSEDALPELTEPLIGKKAAENERFELYVDEATLNVRIVDKQTKREWHGAPPMDVNTPPNNVKFVQAPVHIKYTQGTETSQTYSLQDSENEMTMELIDGGVRAHFTFANHGISFAVEYELTEMGLAATIPFESVQEQGTSRLVSIEVLPFFHAALPWQEGAVFVPDGSGALMHIKPQRMQNFNTYSEYIYGSDPVFLRSSHEMLYPEWRLTMNPKEKIALPVYGLYADGTGFLGIVTEGDHDAKINAIPAGIRNIQLYRVSAEFIYRNDDIIFIGNSGEIPLYQGRMIGGDRRIEFVLLQDEDAHYVGMAEAYRQHLIEHQGLERLVEPEMPLQLHIFAGILRYDVLGKTFIPMTTFEQVKAMIDEYHSRGIKRLEITIDGWTKNGVYGTQPKHFPAASQLGGYKGLEELAAYAQERGVKLYLKANYVRPFEDTGSYKAKRDAVYGIKKEAQASYNYYISSRFNNFSELFHLLKPKRVFDHHIAKELNQYVKLGISGVHLQYMGDTLYSDQDPRNWTTREETKRIWVQVLDLFREEVGGAAVDYGHAYVLGHVDRIDKIPMDHSHFTYLDEAVPFYQIVLHGYIPYSAAPTNLEDDPRVMFLRKLEYGAMPSYELTYEPTQRLQRTMADGLFSSEWKLWFESSIEEYRKLAELYEATYDQPITAHERLSRWVYRTTYANGIQVMVNYGHRPAEADGHRIDAYGYLILEGGR